MTVAVAILFGTLFLLLLVGVPVAFALTDASDSLRSALRDQLGWNARVPQFGEAVDV